MKRGFSMSDVRDAVDPAGEADSRVAERQAGADCATLEPSTDNYGLGTLRRSKSMTAFETEKDAEEVSSRSLSGSDKPVLSTHNLRDVHGLEVLKRCARERDGGGGMTSMPRSLSNSSLSQLVLHDDDDIGAASALMELCGSPAKTSAMSSETEPAAHGAPTLLQPTSRVASDLAPTAPAITLPSLRELLGTSAATTGMSTGSALGMPPRTIFSQQHLVSHQGGVVWDELAAARLGAQMQAYQQLATASHIHNHASAHRPATAAAHEARSSQHAGAGAEVAEGDEGEGKHNKYCHFCQHVKVKRATSMLACENAECARRFCEHCLTIHLSDAMPREEAAGDLSSRGGGGGTRGKWLCPICRKICCCAIGVCDRPHRHCKAYRYRQRRAELAAKRSSANQIKPDGSEAELKMAGGGVAGATAKSSRAAAAQTGGGLGTGGAAAASQHGAMHTAAMAVQDATTQPQASGHLAGFGLPIAKVGAAFPQTSAPVVGVVGSLGGGGPMSFLQGGTVVGPLVFGSSGMPLGPSHPLSFHTLSGTEGGGEGGKVDS